MASRQIVLAEDRVEGGYLTDQQQKWAKKRLETIAKLNDPLKDEDVKCYRGEPDVYIFKPSGAIRRELDEFRVVFRVTEDSLELIAADQRDTVYRKSNNRFNNSK